MVEMLIDDPPHVFHQADVSYIAKMLLVMACIPPRPDSDDMSDQYSIDSFKISAEKIEIMNHGHVHVLKVREHT